MYAKGRVSALHRKKPFVSRTFCSWNISLQVHPGFMEKVPPQSSFWDKGMFINIAPLGVITKAVLTLQAQSRLLNEPLLVCYNIELFFYFFHARFCKCWPWSKSLSHRKWLKKSFENLLSMFWPWNKCFIWLIQIKLIDKLKYVNVYYNLRIKLAI